MKLEILDISKSYDGGKHFALSHFSQTLKPGIYGLLGPNGAGKSTLMNILTQNLPADDGYVLWDGVSTNTLGARFRDRVGYMPQQQNPDTPSGDAVHKARIRRSKRRRRKNENNHRRKKGNTRKALLYGILCSLFLLIQTGCGRKASDSNAFVVGEDWQYQYVDEFPQNQKLAEDEDGSVYFMSGCYVFRHDPSNGATLPLCNRPNCLHQAENDPERREDCHAFLPLSGPVEKSGGGIAYCKGEVIVYYAEEDTEGHLTRVDAITRDGGARRTVRHLAYLPEDFAVHRGRAYYSYSYYDEEGGQHMEVASFGLFGGKEEVLYEASGDAGRDPILLFPVGNALYFTCSGRMAGTLGCAHLFQCALSGGEVKEVELPDGENLAFISGVAGLFDKVLVDALYNPEGRHLLYALDSEGGHPALFAQDIPSRFYSDGERVYMSDSAGLEGEWAAALAASGGAEDPAMAEEAPPALENCKVTVLDADGKPLGSFAEALQKTAGGMPYYDLCFGVGDYAYLLQQVSAYGGTVLFRLDKSEISTANGGLLPLEKVSEIPLSPADLEMQARSQLSG